jgi:queuine tRNA-ribosyltransferase
MSFFKFELIYQSTKSRARVGKIHTPHGVIETPNFVAVGTNGTPKALDTITTKDLGLQLMFCNTYHLLLQPGPQTVKQAGGLHKFINWSGPLITDSGGFQVFSLAQGKVNDELKSRGSKDYQNSVLKISEEGVLFRSYRDGQKILLTPESSVQTQKDLGADIIIPLDELPAYSISPQALKKSLDRTHRWEKRSLDEHLKDRKQQAMYAVIHGGISQDLRSASCNYLSSLPFDGFAIGGSLGKNHQEMFDMLAHTMPQIPTDKPNHLLGIGDLKSMRNCVALGVDTFDSSHPTRCARHGLAFILQIMPNGEFETSSIRILQSANRTNFAPIDKHCTCSTCQNYTLAYLHHLLKANELVAYTLLTIHNIHFMVQLMSHYRQAILDGKL